jgi:hypothetical protein
MQTKIIIGTIAFMLTMIILGFVALNEPARLDAFSAAYEARSIENGAEIFVNNCATCHGIDGRAEQCFDASGNEIGCIGRPLNIVSFSAVINRRVWSLWTGPAASMTSSKARCGRASLGRYAHLGRAVRRPHAAQRGARRRLFVLNWESETLCGAEEGCRAGVAAAGQRSPYG